VAALFGLVSRGSLFSSFRCPRAVTSWRTSNVGLAFFIRLRFRGCFPAARFFCMAVSASCHFLCLSFSRMRAVGTTRVGVLKKRAKPAASPCAPAGRMRENANRVLAPVHSRMGLVVAGFDFPPLDYPDALNFSRFSRGRMSFEKRTKILKENSVLYARNCSSRVQIIFKYSTSFTWTGTGRCTPRGHVVTVRSSIHSYGVFDSCFRTASAAARPMRMSRLQR